MYICTCYITLPPAYSLSSKGFVMPGDKDYEDMFYTSICMSYKKSTEYVACYSDLLLLLCWVFRRFKECRVEGPQERQHTINEVQKKTWKIEKSI